MKIVSNKEFEVLTSKCSPRLKAMAKSRSKTDPTGSLTAADLDAYMEACSYSGDHKSVQWLKNLKHMAKSGMLRQLRRGTTNWNNHVIYVNALHKKGEIKFNLGDAVMCKETGKQGQVIDYMPDEKEFLVVLNPFQIKTYKAGDLEKVAHKQILASLYRADDGNEEIVVEADSPREAAEEYVRTGQWDMAEPGATVDVHVWPAEPRMSMREADDAGLLTTVSIPPLAGREPKKVARKKNAKWEDDPDFGDFGDKDIWDEDDPNRFEPSEEDAFLQSTGPLGSRTTVTVGGKYLGEFRSDDEAIRALKVWMEENSFFPTVWQVSDHGNMEPIDINTW